MDDTNLVYELKEANRHLASIAKSLEKLVNHNPVVPPQSGLRTEKIN